MSAVKTSDYYVKRGSDALKLHGWSWKVCVDGRAVDAFRSQCAAEYAARLLNRGLATINHHAVIGCRVEVK